jgi:hypothetical protein
MSEEHIIWRYYLFVFILIFIHIHIVLALVTSTLVTLAEPEPRDNNTRRHRTHKIINSLLKIQMKFLLKHRLICSCVPSDETIIN